MPVSQSSHIQSHDYSETYVFVVFQNGSVYRYGPGVPQKEYDEWMKQGGSGAYFHSVIEKYPMVKLVGGMKR